MGDEEVYANGDDVGSVMRIGRRTFVSNLAWKTSWQDLKDKFREVGEVIYTSVTRDADGRSKGWGIVEFEKPEEAVQAVNLLNGTELAGRKILVREDREDRDVKQYNKENGIEEPPRPRRPRRSEGDGTAGNARSGAKQAAAVSSGLQVVVQGLPWKYTLEDLNAMFDDVGQIAEAEVQMGRDGRSRGYGTARFHSAEAAQAAISSLNGTELEGRTLTVRLDKYA